MSDRAIVQVSDRRLTRNGQLIDDLAMKAVCVTCMDATFSLGYTGLAELGRARTRTDVWTVERLAREGLCCYGYAQIVSFLKSELEHTIRQMRLRGRDRAITLVLSGYGPTGAFLTLLTNAEDHKGATLHTVSDRFQVHHFHRNHRQMHRLDLCANGSGEAAMESMWEPLRTVLRRYYKSDPSDIARAMVYLIRRASRDAEHGGYVGRNCIATLLAPDGSFVCEDHRENLGYQIHPPHYLTPGMAFRDIEIRTGPEPPSWW